MKRGKNQLSNFWKRNRSILLLILIVFFLISFSFSVVGIIIGAINGNPINAIVSAMAAFVAGIFLFAFWRLRTLRG
ncbi:MAG: hypothetical protein ACXABK_05385 [Candidatus Heimdallarchaeaceae archaeon]|jgi:hypothetical protein